MDHFRIQTGSSAQILELYRLVLSLAQMAALEEVLTDSKVDIVSADATTGMVEFVEAELPHLDKVRAWWDSLEGAIDFTPLGLAVGYSNAKRFDELGGLNSLSQVIGAA